MERVSCLWKVLHSAVFWMRPERLASEVALKAAQSRGSSRSVFLALLTGSARLCAITHAPDASRNHSLETMSDFLREMVSRIQFAGADLVRSANFRESPVALQRFLRKPVPSPNPRAANLRWPEHPKPSPRAGFATAPPPLPEAGLTYLYSSPAGSNRTCAHRSAIPSAFPPSRPLR